MEKAERQSLVSIPVILVIAAAISWAGSHAGCPGCGEDDASEALSIGNARITLEETGSLSVPAVPGCVRKKAVVIA